MDARFTKRQGARLVELLQLAFLQVLATRVSPAQYVVKGGANLRLFDESTRRSQHIDFDYLGGAFWRIEDQIDSILVSPALTGFLRLAGFEIADVSKPKQTDTTRRWKFTVVGEGAWLNSKIEFSARGAGDPEREMVSARLDALALSVGLRAVRAQHYLPPAAIRQRITALSQRSETEPRDVFDLDFLFARYPRSIQPGDVDPVLLDDAIGDAVAIGYDAYEEMVLDFLEDEIVEIYARPEVWEDMVLGVVARLESLR